MVTSCSSRLSLVGIALAVLVSFVFSRPVTAGSGPGVITCKSIARAGAATTLSGEIPGDYEVFDLKIRKGNDEYSMKSLGKVDRDLDADERTRLEENGVIARDRIITIVEDFKRGVFSLALRRSEGYDLRLYALPGTVRSRITSNSKKASFDAMLLQSGSDVYPDWNKAIRMRCTFDHSI